MKITYLYGINSRMFLCSAAETMVALRSCRLRFLPFEESKCLLKPLLRLIFPLAVTRNLLAAALLVLILGTLISSLVLNIYLGVSSIAMFRPSKRGSISTLAMSCICSTTLRNACRPSSGCVISRPRKKTDTLTR
jgi:hypothetical protein